MSSVERALRRPELWFVLALSLMHAALTAWLGLARFASLHNRTFDLALYARMAWGLVHLELGDPILGGHGLGGHASIVLLPLGLLGAVFGTVPTLLVAQSLCVALAALPIAALAARRLGPSAGVVAAFVWLLYPNLGHVTTYEFHPGTLAVLPLSCALEAFDRQKPRTLLWWCVAVVACRASLALTTLMLGLLCLRGAPALRRPGRALVLGSILYGAFAMWLLTKSSGGVESSATLHFGKWGGSPLLVLKALFSEPMLVFSHFMSPARLFYPAYMLAPLALLPLLRPRFLLLALPTVAQNLLSDFPSAAALDSHYLTPAVPALVVAAIEGLERLASMHREGHAFRSRFAGLGMVTLATLVSSALWGGLPWSRDFHRADISFDARTAAARAIFALIGSHASVQAPYALLPHLAERKRVHRAPPPERVTDFIVLDVSHRRSFAHNEDLLRTFEEPLVRAWLARRDHRLELAQGDLLLLRRGRSPRTGLVRAYFMGSAPPTSGRALTACLSVRGAKLAGKYLWLELVARGPCGEDLALRIGTGAEPKRVDLLFDGLLSPAHLKAGDLLRSRHRLKKRERAAILRHGLRIGALRSSGARPDPSDPKAIDVPLNTVRR